MDDRIPHRWRTWRVALSADGREQIPQPLLSTPGTIPGFQTLSEAVHHPAADSDPLADLRAEPPGPDGIRQRLVARVKELIAQGNYDTPERWEAAEEQLLRRIERGC
jgi:hypothetical protein